MIDGSHDMLVKPLPAGCRLTAIFDSCHSGTVMDLPYVVSAINHVPIHYDWDLDFPVMTLCVFA
jgi:hypothetical protein